mmetsp:Transcript_13280/g.21741  ORF Transcript_13280/g.21741 Transcript_13280/m.21741 type:complete len:152 (+) Transcript_13280:89-544(+)
MVRIINGEIVQDNDPRLKNYPNSSQSSGASSSGRRGFQDMSSLRQRQQQSGSSHSTGPGASNPQSGQHGRDGQAPPSASPLDGLANAIGISDKFITIPAIPPLGLSSTRIGLVYFLLLGVMYMLFDYRAFLFALVVYVMFKHQQGQGEAQL